MRSLVVFGILLLSALAVACGDDDGVAPDAFTDAGALEPAVATQDVSESGALPFLAVPFPNDLMIGPDGTFDMDGPPNARSVWAVNAELYEGLRGFCGDCGVHFPVSGSFDISSLPADADRDFTASATDSIVLMELESGSFVPLEVQWSRRPGTVDIRPRVGAQLVPGATYVAALTDRLRGADGAALAAAPLFIAARDGGGDAAAERLRGILEPGLVALEDAGVSRGSVVSATVFTIEDKRDEWLALRDVAQEASVPALTVTGVFESSDGTLDELLGTPASPGAGLAPAETEGETAVEHDHFDRVLIGTFDSPRVVQGEGSDIGFVRRDAEGHPVAGPVPEAVPFLLAIPSGVDTSALPVAFFHVGNPGNLAVGLLVADSLAEQGIATFAIDPFQMGARAASATDERHELRGTDGPDGLYEHDGMSILLRLQGLEGQAEGTDLHLGYGRGAFSQWVVDALASFRVLKESDLAPLVAAEESLDGIAFDPGGLFYLSLSNGSQMGGLAVSLTEGIAAVAMNVPYDSTFGLACAAPLQEPALDLFLGLVGASGSFDHIERRGCLDPYLDLVRWASNHIRLSHASGLLDAPLHGGSPPDLLFQLADRDATTGTSPGDALVTLFDVPVVGSFPTVPATETTYPVSANRETPSGMVTAAAVRFADTTHEMMIRREQESAYAAPVVRPFDEIEPPETVPIPVDGIQRQYARFFASALAGGRATVSAPE